MLDVHDGECTMLHVGGCSVVDTEHGRYSLSCMQKLCVGSLSYVVKFLLLLNVADIDCLLC